MAQLVCAVDALAMHCIFAGSDSLRLPSGADAPVMRCNFYTFLFFSWIQVSPDVGLVQSSTVADQIPFKFEQGQEGMVAGSYLEFAQRAVLPQFKHLPVSHC